MSWRKTITTNSAEPTSWRDTITSTDEQQPQEVPRIPIISSFNEAVEGAKKGVIARMPESWVEAAEGAKMGALQGISGGWADEIIAGAKSMLPNVKYEQELAKQREQFNKASEKAPWAYNIADIGTSIATAAKLPVAKGAQIALGAFEGAGRAEDNKVLGGVVGGTMAAAIPKGLQVAGKKLQEAGEKALPKVAGFFNKKFLKEQMLKSEEGAAGITQKILAAEEKLGERIIEGDTKKVWDQAVKYKDKVGKQIGEIFKKEQENVLPGIDEKTFTSYSLLAQLHMKKLDTDAAVKLLRKDPKMFPSFASSVKEIGQEDTRRVLEYNKDIVSQLRDAAENLDPKVDQKLITKLNKEASKFEKEGFVSVYDIWKTRQALDKRIYNNNKLMKNTEAEKIVRDILNQQIDKKIAESQVSGTKVAQELFELNKQYKFAKNLEQAAESALSKGRPTAVKTLKEGGMAGLAPSYIFGPYGLITAVPSITSYMMSKPVVARKAAEVLPKVGAAIEKTGKLGPKAVAGTAAAVDREPTSTPEEEQ